MSVIVERNRYTMGCDVLHAERQDTAMRRPVLFRTDLAQAAPDLHTRHERIAAAGFDGVELDVGVCGGGGTSPLTEQQAQMLEALASSDVRVGALAGRCTTTDGARALEVVGRLLREAARVRATCLNLTLPPVADASEEVAFNRYRNALNFAYNLLHHGRHDAEVTGVALALEAGAGRSLLSPVELREIIDAANSWAVGVCIDVDRIAQIGCPVDWIKTLRQRVHAVRISEGWLGNAAKKTTGQGVASVGAIAEVLDEIAYDRPIILAAAEIPDGIPARLTQIVTGIAAGTA